MVAALPPGTDSLEAQQAPPCVPSDQSVSHDPIVTPRIVECPNCHAPVPVSDTLCFRCGSELPSEAYDSLR
jgi:predicted amidophosphoribosyltransferase